MMFRRLSVRGIWTGCWIVRNKAAVLHDIRQNIINQKIFTVNG